MRTSSLRLLKPPMLRRFRHPRKRLAKSKEAPQSRRSRIAQIPEQSCGILRTGILTNQLFPFYLKWFLKFETESRLGSDGDIPIAGKCSAGCASACARTGADGCALTTAREGANNCANGCS